jgi:membrane protein
MAAGSEGNGAGVPAETDTRASAQATLDRLPPRLRGFVVWLLSRWPGRIAVRSLYGAAQIDIFDRSMTIAAQIFTSVIPILILFATWADNGRTGAIADAAGMPANAQSILQDAIAGADSAAFGVVGTIIVLVSATSLSRALTRAFVAVWRVPKVKTDLGAAWRWLSVVLVLAISVLVVRTLTELAGGLPPGGVWQVVVSLACDTAIALFIPWALLSGAVRPRLLIPGALLFALLMLVFRPASSVWLPRALEVSTDRYGPIGVAFTYLAWLYVASFGLLATALVGNVIATDRGLLGRRIRGEQP